MQILDEGRLTDSQGRTVSFKNTIIIMTSNIGSHLILEAKELTDKIKDAVEKLLQASFRPEFLNRIDAIVFFRKLSEKDVAQIAEIQLQTVIKRLLEKHITLTIDETVVNYLSQEGYSPEFGARPLKRTIQQYVLVPISQYLLKNPDTRNISLQLKKDKIIIE